MEREFYTESQEKECILIVENFEHMNNFVSSNLRKRNYEVIQCYSKKEAFKQLKTNCVSCVILDLNIDNNEDGLSILHSIRLQNKMLPVLIVSAETDIKTKLQCFQEGCDDFIAKPFYVEELIMRIDRLITKYSMMGYKKEPIATVYSCGSFEIDMEKGTLLKNGRNIPVRKKQLDLMLYFIQNPNKILPFQSIYQNVWNEQAPTEKTLESNIYVNIRSLRLLIENDRKNPQHIVSVSKSGYIFVPG